MSGGDVLLTISFSVKSQNYHCLKADSRVWISLRGKTFPTHPTLLTQCCFLSWHTRSRCDFVHWKGLDSPKCCSNLCQGSEWMKALLKQQNWVQQQWKGALARPLIFSIMAVTCIDQQLHALKTTSCHPTPSRLCQISEKKNQERSAFYLRFSQS